MHSNQNGDVSDTALPFYKLSALLSYLLAYFYVYFITNGNNVYFVLASLIAIAITESNQHHQRFRDTFNQKSAEDILLFSAMIIQLIAVAIWGFQSELGQLQFLGLHVTFVYYVLSHNNSLIQGQFGSLFFIDAWRGFVSIPFRNIRYRSLLLSQTPKKAVSEPTSGTSKTKLSLAIHLLVAVIISLIVVLFAISQLQAVSASFALVTEHISDWMDDTLLTAILEFSVTSFLIRLMISLPVGAYLFGLIFAPLNKQTAQTVTYQTIQEQLKTKRRLPSFSSYIVIGSLCVIYSLFLVIALSDMSSLFGINHITPQDASQTAVDGFWQLIRVALLNFATLGCSYFLSATLIWTTKIGKILLNSLFAYSLAFAVLAAWKLFGIYIFHFGFTPLRLISGWFVTVLIAWSLLILIRLNKPFQSIRIGLFYIVITFSALPYLYALLIP